MKTVEVRKLNSKDLVKKANDLREEIAEMRRRIRMGETSNVRSIRVKRRDLARVLTVMSENLLKETR